MIESGWGHGVENAKEGSLAVALALLVGERHLLIVRAGAEHVWSYLVGERHLANHTLGWGARSAGPAFKLRSDIVVHDGEQSVLSADVRFSSAIT